MTNNHTNYLKDQIFECFKKLEDGPDSRAEFDLPFYQDQLRRQIHSEAQGPAFTAFFVVMFITTILIYWFFGSANVGDFGEILYLVGVAAVAAPSYGAAMLAQSRKESELFTKYADWLKPRRAS